MAWHGGNHTVIAYAAHRVRAERRERVEHERLLLSERVDPLAHPPVADIERGEGDALREHGGADRDGVLRLEHVEPE